MQRTPVAVGDFRPHFVGKSNANGTGTFAGSLDTHHFEIAGIVSGVTFSGTVVLGDIFDYDGHHLTFASPVTSWTATLQP